MDNYTRQSYLMAVLTFKNAQHFQPEGVPVEYIEYDAEVAGEMRPCVAIWNAEAIKPSRKAFISEELRDQVMARIIDLAARRQARIKGSRKL